MVLATLADLPKLLATLYTGKQMYEPKVVHHFSDGVCVREMHVTAGTLVVGAIHKTNHITMLIKGSMQLRIGDESRLIEAPYTFEALAGTRKLGLAYTDCVVSNIMPTTLTNIEDIEAMFTDKHEDNITKIRSSL